MVTLNCQPAADNIRNSYSQLYLHINRKHILESLSNGYYNKDAKKDAIKNISRFFVEHIKNPARSVECVVEYYPGTVRQRPAELWVTYFVHECCIVVRQHIQCWLAEWLCMMGRQAGRPSQSATTWLASVSKTIVSWTRHSIKKPSINTLIDMSAPTARHVQCIYT